MGTVMYGKSKGKYAELSQRLLKYVLAKVELDRCKKEERYWMQYAENAREEVLEHIGNLQEQVKQVLNLRKEIEQTINLLEDERLKTIMRLRYIDGTKWEDIFDLLDLDDRYIMRLHVKALGIISNKLKED